jgi:hypothetical protein
MTLRDPSAAVVGELTIEGAGMAPSQPIDLQISVRVKAGRPEIVLVLSEQTTWVVSAEPAAAAFIAGALVQTPVEVPRLIYPGQLGTCDGLDGGDGRCLACTLPLARHPVIFRTGTYETA